MSCLIKFGMFMETMSSAAAQQQDDLWCVSLFRENRKILLPHQSESAPPLCGGDFALQPDEASNFDMHSSHAHLSPHPVFRRNYKKQNVWCSWCSCGAALLWWRSVQTHSLHQQFEMSHRGKDDRHSPSFLLLSQHLTPLSIHAIVNWNSSAFEQYVND